VYLRVKEQGGSSVSGSMELFDGASWYGGPVSGTYDATSGAISLSGGGVSVQGTLSGDTGVGTVSFGGRRAGWALRRP
jgi:hypothetical protein